MPAALAPAAFVIGVAGMVVYAMTRGDRKGHR
jgi:hypothetical protein